MPALRRISPSGTSSPPQRAAALGRVCTPPKLVASAIRREEARSAPRPLARRARRPPWAEAAHHGAPPRRGRGPPGRPGVAHRHHLGRVAQGLGDRLGVVTLARQGAGPRVASRAVRQPRLERGRRSRPCGCATREGARGRHLDRRWRGAGRSGRSGRSAICCQEATRQVGRRAPGGPLAEHGGGRVVHRHQPAAAAGDIRADGGDVAHVEPRVAGGLQPPRVKTRRRRPRRDRATRSGCSHAHPEPREVLLGEC